MRKCKEDPLDTDTKLCPCCNRKSVSKKIINDKEAPLLTLLDDIEDFRPYESALYIYFFLLKQLVTFLFLLHVISFYFI